MIIKVLQYIFSPVEQNLRKQNAPMRIRYPRQDGRPEDLDNLRARPDEYDFLASLSTSPMRTIRYEDLDSAGMSLALHEGLTLWDTTQYSNSRPTQPNPERALQGSDAMKDTVIELPKGSVPVEDSGDIMMPDASTTTVDGMGGNHSDTGSRGAAGEEEAVEMMLL